MSHSRIFCVTAEEKQKKYPGEDEIYDYSQSFADYVADAEDQEESINWLKGCAGDALHWVDAHSFTVEHPEAILEADFREFQDALKKLQEINFEEFCSRDWKLPYLLYRVKAAYSNEYVFHFYSDDQTGVISGMFTYSDFLRRAEAGTVYHILHVFDYHC